MVDHLRLPYLTRWLGRRRSWMLVAQVGISAGLVVMALLGPDIGLGWFSAVAVFIAFCSATQDLTIDAYRIESVVQEYQAAMAAMYILGYRIALLVAGAGALYLAELTSWTGSYLLMAALMWIGVVTVLVIAEPQTKVAIITPHQAQFIQRLKHRIKYAAIDPFMNFFQRYSRVALLILLFISIYRISDITLGVMANPFYLDMGYSKTEIAQVSKFFGFFMTIFGAALGGILVVRFGAVRLLVVGAILVAVTNLLFIIPANTAPHTGVLALVISADNLSGGIATTVFIAYLSSLTHADYTATQYALFSSLMTLPAKLIGGFSGIMVDSYGYTDFFIYAAVLGIPLLC